MKNYIIATVKSWNIDNYSLYTNDFPGKWHLITDKNELNESVLKEIDPEYIFFPHWSWIVPKEIVQNYKCVCFHMTDVPYGRGGSPLQNLISMGHRITKLSVLRMTSSLDAGPVYIKYPLTLDGNAEDILKRASLLSFEAIAEMINGPIIIPTEQIGPVTNFKRRTPEQSEFKEFEDIEKIYDHLRMLDAEGYPRAYLNFKGYKIEFFDAKFAGDNINARVHIKKSTDNE